MQNESRGIYGKPLMENNGDDKAAEAKAPSSPAKRRYTAETKIDMKGQAALIELDQYGFITSWSIAAERLYGYTMDEMMGKHFASLFCEGDLQHGRAVHELISADKKENYCVFGWQMRKNGKQFWTYSESTKIPSGFQLLIVESKAPAQPEQKS